MPKMLGTEGKIGPLTQGFAGPPAEGAGVPQKGKKETRKRKKFVAFLP